MDRHLLWPHKPLGRTATRRAPFSFCLAGCAWVSFFARFRASGQLLVIAGYLKHRGSGLLIAHLVDEQKGFLCALSPMRCS
jgi:hypothetical protein